MQRQMVLRAPIPPALAPRVGTAARDRGPAMTETPDPALAIIEALEARDPRALELLYHRFGETLGGIAVRFGWGDNQRLLFAHEVIWKIFDLYLRKNQPQLKDRNAFPGWVRKV